MKSPLTIQKYLALNDGKYLRESVKIPQVGSSFYVTTHPETAASDLLHYHEQAHLSFIINGGVIDKRQRSEAEKTSGDLLFFHAGEPHQTFYKGFPVKNINVELNDEFFLQNEVSEAKFNDSIAQNANAKLSLLKIYKEMRTADEFSLNSLETLLLGLIDGEKTHERMRPMWLKKVVELLNDKWNEEISLQDLANVARVHPKTISKYFPFFLNCTLGEYRRKIKVEKSLSLIKTSKLTLTEIAYECGFYDQSHFTSTFKNLTGFLPKQFKKL